jgi:two-component system copper resistance phosphate regulon response regulator CusR
MTRILIAQDAGVLVAQLTRKLEDDGFQTVGVANGDVALDLAMTGDFDLMLLDVGLPGRDGFSVLSELRRQRSEMPIILLSNRDSSAEIVAGLDGGADDYVKKPFELAELVARVRLRARVRDLTEVFVVSHGELKLDMRTDRIEVAGEHVQLSTSECALAATFLQRPGEVISLESLLRDVWGYRRRSDTILVEACMFSLRRKLGRQRIRLVPGSGYQLVAAASSA